MILLVTELLDVQFGWQSYLWLTKLDFNDFVNQLYGYVQNWTPLSPFTIIYNANKWVGLTSVMTTIDCR